MKNESDQISFFNRLREFHAYRLCNFNNNLTEGIKLAIGVRYPLRNRMHQSLYRYSWHSIATYNRKRENRLRGFNRFSVYIYREL